MRVAYSAILILLGTVALALTLWLYLRYKPALFIVASGSMESTIPVMSLIIVLPKGSYHEGDIITYKYKNQNNHVITHRIIKVKKYSEKNLYTTKGDANADTDTIPVSQNEIIGRVHVAIPYVGYLRNELSDPLTISLSFYIPIGFLIGKGIRVFIIAYLK